MSRSCGTAGDRGMAWLSVNLGRDIGFDGQGTVKLKLIGWEIR